MSDYEVFATDAWMWKCTLCPVSDIAATSEEAEEYAERHLAWSHPSSPGVLYRAGEPVYVYDPEHDRTFAGIVRQVTTTGLYIEGPLLEGDSRSLCWTIRADKLDQYVTRALKEKT